MEPTYDFGMIGIGVMGSNLLLNIADQGYSVIGFDLKQERADALEAAARPGTTVKGVTDVTLLAAGLKRPRKLMILVPAGKPVDDVIANLLPHLQEGDILIDGGNSYFKDTNRRFRELQPRGIHFFGMGVSGGELGARLGPSLMPGGDAAAYEYLKPILESVAASHDGVPCVAFMGREAAGHYVKMVHNGIEYALMQLLSEAYDLMRRGGYSNKQLATVFSRWNEGPLRSYLVEITADIFTVLDDEDASGATYLIDRILDAAASKGTGKWTSVEGMDLPVAIPTIDAAVSARTLSGGKELRLRVEALFPQEPRAEAVFTEEDAAELETALSVCFVIAYAQGLSLLVAASDAYQMEIPMASVVRVWRAGCIIRSGLLPLFADAFDEQPKLPSVLLHPALASWLQQRTGALRGVVSKGVAGGIPLAAMSSALAYFDALRSGRGPTNLVQAQRDYFGAHTYRRTDREGVFHTEWNRDKTQSDNPVT
ncbi:NADP-dependent phosphogluconate dehydrogenase [Flaviaesturariibacter amylovorans]|uniref:6-phosphogluconate dehydrogenase, decarboxylating n=1 Tax=Flaviaesturariibacter amylovorans TaxID=1084520 RepID=A0ABP8GI15_9BACT